MPEPERQARDRIDRLLTQAGWIVQDPHEVRISAHRAGAIREFPLRAGHGFADYLLYVDGSAAGVIEAKKSGHTLSGVNRQSARYTQRLPDGLPTWGRPLRFACD